MKKMLAILMALLLGIGCCAAYAETETAAETETVSVVGTWYATMLGNQIVLTLNEDGTATVAAQDGEVSATWTQEGNTVSVTAEGEEGAETMVLTYEDGALLDKTTGMLNFYESVEMAEADTGDENVLNMLVGALDSMTQQPESAPAEPQGEMSLNTTSDLTILRENLNVIDSYGSLQAVYIAEVQNDTDAPVFITGGQMTLVDPEGKDLENTEWMYNTGSTYLEPGEKSIVSFNIYPEMEGEIAGCRVEIQSGEDQYNSKDVQMEVADAVFAAKDPEDSWGEDTMRVTISNPLEENLKQVSIAVVLEDSNGYLITVDAQGLYNVELTPGSSVVIVNTVYSYITDWCTANGITPAKVTAYAWYPAEN